MRLLSNKIFWFAILIGLVIGIQNHEKGGGVPEDDPSRDLYYVPHPKYIKMLSGGFAAVASDIYWIKTVLYFGKRSTTDDLAMISRQLTENLENTAEYSEWKKDVDARYKYLPDLITIVTELDPYFLQPYLFGGLILSMTAGRPEKSLEVLEKGTPPGHASLVSRRPDLNLTRLCDGRCQRPWRRPCQCPLAPHRDESPGSSL